VTARAMFRASIVLGDDSIAVRFLAAARDARIHFRLLHAADGVPVAQRMVHPGTGEVVPRAEIDRGLEIEPGRFVVLTSDELDALTPETDRRIEIDAFVPRDQVDPVWWQRPYYLGPDGDPAAYHALASALEKTGRVAICRWAMRKKRYRGALDVRDGRLVIVTLRPADQVVLPAELPAPPGGDLDERELAMAEQLVGAMVGELDLDEYENDDRRRVRALLEQKRGGKPVRIPKTHRKAETDDLAAALERSLTRAIGASRAVQSLPRRLDRRTPSRSLMQTIR
jgi:DNA end-binding protein Ku